MSNKMYDGITGRSPIATDDLGYIGTGQKASQIMSNGTTDYNDLSNKPTINNVELSGNKTSSDIGLQSALTETQTAAVNSGVTAETVSQVETNTTNISLIDHAVGTKLFFTETEPTGTISVGSYWISTTATKVYVDKNIYDSTATDTDNGYVNNAYINQDGTTTTNDGYVVSEYIPVTASTAYKMDLGAQFFTPAVCYYNSSKEYISGTRYGSENPKTITTPSTAAYIRISVSKANMSVTAVYTGDTRYLWQ